MKSALKTLLTGLFLLLCAAGIIYTIPQDYTLMLFRLIPIRGILYDILAGAVALMLLAAAFVLFKSMFEKKQ